MNTRILLPNPKQTSPSPELDYSQQSFEGQDVLPTQKPDGWHFAMYGEKQRIGKNKFALDKPVNIQDADQAFFKKLTETAIG